MALGIYRIDGIDSWGNLLTVTGATLTVPFYEELAFRGVVFRIIEGIFGSWAGLAVSSLVFGLVHLANDGETFAGIASIVIVFGLETGLFDGGARRAQQYSANGNLHRYNRAALILLFGVMLPFLR
jgi:membrane protease YdiL (CAAX protease family)